MSLQINTNVAALNAQRNLAGTNRRLGGIFEKLSSGMRINRAADDAAGLAISEKMRAQIRGMQQGQRNAQDGVSMLQTTEGALNEVHNTLQRIRELSVEAGNTTLSASDRQAIGEEMLALRTEIDNIGNRTRFNGQQLLTGALAVTLDSANSTADTVTYANGGATTSVSSIDVSRADAGETYTFSAAGAVLTLTHDDGNGYVRTETATVQAMGASGSQSVIFEELGVTLNLAHDANAANHTGANLANALDTTTIVTGGSGNATFRVGAEVGDDISVAFQDMRSSALGNASKLDTLIPDNDAVSTGAKADTLLASVDAAMAQVSLFRAKLGAVQNQMDTAVNSLAVSVENLSASESRIRDADIAEVSSKMISQQIMQQAGVAVLAQANTAPQAVLSLLRGG
ncbi:MAG: flagellin [Dehalococcoidia bacterium]|nr:MAG: flagellin [Dehalococcoidia bacterium]